jgi:NAD(P)-dependent dehydrogenase (short-subunit alcohol dehydrogenase family)
MHHIVVPKMLEKGGGRVINISSDAARVGPGDIPGIVAFLASEEAGFITGTDILIDGGWTAQ